MAFHIGFVTRSQADAGGDDWHCAAGELTLGDRTERFLSDLGTWSRADYEAQWRAAVRRLAEGWPSSALVTSYRGPAALFHAVWPLWREGASVYVQEHLLLPVAPAANPIDPARAWDYVLGPRPTTAAAPDDGAPPAQWRVPLAHVIAFAVHR